MGLNINKKAIGGFVKQLGKGILKEAVSYVPIFGDNISNYVENTIGTGVSVQDPLADRIADLVGKSAPWILLALLLAFGAIDRETFSFLLESSK